MRISARFVSNWVSGLAAMTGGDAHGYTAPLQRNGAQRDVERALLKLQAKPLLKLQAKLLARVRAALKPDRIDELEDSLDELECARKSLEACCGSEWLSGLAARTGEDAHEYGASSSATRRSANLSVRSSSCERKSWRVLAPATSRTAQ